MNIDELKDKKIKPEMAAVQASNTSERKKFCGAASFDELIKKDKEAIENDWIETPDTTQKNGDSDTKTQEKEPDAAYLQQLNAQIVQENINRTINQTQNNTFDLLSEIDRMFDVKCLKMDITRMTKDDVELFKKLADDKTAVLHNMNSNPFQPQIAINEGMPVSYRSMDFSKGLSNLIEHAYTTQRPVRLDFDGNSSVILKIDKEGKLSAEFMSANFAMEQALKSNLQNLRNKFDAENIPYKHIGYKENSSGGGRQKKQNKQQNGD